MDNIIAYRFYILYSIIVHGNIVKIFNRDIERKKKTDRTVRLSGPLSPVWLGYVDTTTGFPHGRGANGNSKGTSRGIEPVIPIYHVHLSVNDFIYIRTSSYDIEYIINAPTTQTNDRRKLKFLKNIFVMTLRDAHL